jgi:hypothetical protein
LRRKSLAAAAPLGMLDGVLLWDVGAGADSQAAEPQPPRADALVASASDECSRSKIKPRNAFKLHWSA